jgi:predicted amino acid dehydrogenase
VIGRGPAITTGNALTAEMAIRAVVKVLERRGGSLDEANVAIVGAMGSVGRICAKLIARTNPRSVLLVGNPNGGLNALHRLRAETANLCGSPVHTTTSLSDLSRCDVVLSATSSPFPLLDDVFFKAGTIICDLARPPDTSAKLRDRADVSVIEGGLVAFPDKSFRLGIGNLQGYRPGTQLACFAETALLALAGCNTNICVGKNDCMVDVDFVRRLTDEHRFDVVEPEFDALDFSVTPATGRPHTKALRLGA